jgi:peroxidase
LPAATPSAAASKCFFIEADAKPIDPEYKKNISLVCDGANRDRGSVPMDMITPNVFDSNYMGMDPGTEPMHKDMATKLESFVPIFGPLTVSDR